MKKIFTIILIIALWLYSCSKEKVIENKKITQDNKQDQTYPTKDSCWIISCWLQKHLEEQYQNWKISIEKINFFKKRLSWLLMRFSDKDTLIKSPDFKTFVDDFYKEFYYWENNYSYDEKNYFRYISLPQIISEAFNENNIEDNWEYLETVMTSIKERYFTSTYEKEALVKDFEDTLKETVNKIDISKIDKERLKNDKKYFINKKLIEKYAIKNQQKFPPLRMELIYRLTSGNVFAIEIGSKANIFLFWLTSFMKSFNTYKP